MKPRSKVTPFRPSQVRIALEGVLRATSAHLMGTVRLRTVVRELAGDDEFWASLNPQPPEPGPLTVSGKPSTPATSSVLTTPIGDHGTRIGAPESGHD